MKLSSIEVDLDLVEQGDWVDDIPDLPGIRILARGSQNDDYRMLEQRLIKKIPTALRVDGVRPADVDRILGKCLLETVVLDVEGLTEDDEVTPIKYTKEIGAKLLTRKYRAFLNGAAYAGAVVANRRKVDQATEVKN